MLVATCGACAKKFARKVGNKKNITIFVKKSTKMKAKTVLLLFIKENESNNDIITIYHCDIIRYNSNKYNSRTRKKKGKTRTDN